MRFWLSVRLFRGRTRPGISFGPEDLRSLGIIGSVALEIIKFVAGIVLAVVASFSFYIIYLIITDAGT